MYPFKIGVLLESFRTDVDSALQAAVDCGVEGIQVLATTGEMDARTITMNQKQEFVNKVKAHGLVISALCGDFICGNPYYSFKDRNKKEEIITRSKQIMTMAKELGTNVVTTHIGVVPADKNSDGYKVMQEICGELARCADGLDAHFAIETGPETAATLKPFLDSLHSRGVGVNLDPANLVMVTGDDPVQAVYTLKDYIVHTHAKDGRRLIVGDPEVIYGEIEAEIQDARYFEELPLGTGEVDFPAYLKALNEIGYQGFLTIEREVGATPEKDIRDAVQFLNNLIK